MQLNVYLIHFIGKLVSRFEIFSYFNIPKFIFFNVFYKKVCTSHSECDILRVERVWRRSLSIPSRVELGTPGQLAINNKHIEHKIK